jgi:hypothetical protein
MIDWIGRTVGVGPEEMLLAFILIVSVLILERQFSLEKEVGRWGHILYCEL